MVDSIEKIVSLCKRRGFVYPGSEIYGGLANSWDYGPLGVELKNNINNLWWQKFVHQRDDMVGLDAALIMNPKVWEASGHLATFSDPLVECKKCHERFRIDQLKGEKCPSCGGELTESKQFNLMLKTFLGPAEEKTNTAYLRPEIAQAMFVNFKQVLETARVRLPFGIASQGKAFRNEITPGNFIFRTREFNLMEFEYFVRENEWEQWFEYWQKEMRNWLADLGINMEHVHEVEISSEDRAHYSKRTVDFEFDYPFGRKELYGLAYRTDFDLKNHFKEPPYRDAETDEVFYPHVIEPTFGLDRSVLAALCSAYDDSDKDRLVLKLKPNLAPYKAAVFPLVANKPELVGKAREIHLQLKTNPYTLNPIFDDRGNIGKRYYSQDEIGTPYCVTIDYQTLEDETVTVRDRDTMKQERISISNLTRYIVSNIIQT